jgi:cellulose synthase/poly-beta-1,6-N-acetylglucosamine synthase-like glycosyltransferase
VAELLIVGAFLFLIVSTHPFVTYPLSLALIRRFSRTPLQRQAAGAAPARLDHAICLCAYNEAAVIERTIENLLELRRRTGQLQILLYVDGASDGTDEIARRYADQIELVVSPERRGKSYGLNRLSSLVRAPILLLADANVDIAPDALVNMEKYFQMPEVGCVCGHLVYSNGGDSVTAATGSLYWRLEERIKKLESETGSVMGADGSLYAMRSQLYRPIPEGVADDMFLSLAVLCDGYRVVRAEDVRVFERAGTVAKDEFRRKIRIGCQAYSTHRALWSQLRRLDGLSVYKYISHKLLRWFTVFTLIGAAVTAFAAVAVLGGVGLALVLAAAGLVGLWLAWKLRFRPVPMLVDMFQAFMATGIGVCQALTGARVKLWEPARSPLGSEER